MTRSSLDTCFVKRSAGFSSPLTSLNSNDPSLTRCWTQRLLVSTWRNLRRPWRPQMPIAAIESVQTLSAISTPRSSISNW